ncbi:hypothetical protein CALCODRAFT_558992 [Calocera cornea HHB12733]|uniref:Uncharacterized protein n=1 Tax=Calocera cornea HHB12733 TaxID=1353952 RepID=A0A165CF24_9BASI|nr:hypothetical protein CALCODRAFT_558992 [Calocera cornea HHB12733]
MSFANVSSPSEQMVRLCESLGMQHWSVEKLESFRQLFITAAGLAGNGSPPSSSAVSLSSSFMGTPNDSPNSGTISLPPSPIVDHILRLENRVDSLEQASEGGTIKRRTRPTRMPDVPDASDADSDQPTPQSTRVGRKKRKLLSEAEVEARTYLLTQVREAIHTIIGFKTGGIMPSKGGPQLEQEEVEAAEDSDSSAALQPVRMLPDFSKNMKAKANLAIMTRAAKVVLEAELDNDDSQVATECREAWLTKATLLDLARAVWPGLAKIYKDQQKEVEDHGEKKRKEKSAARRVERRKTHAGLLAKALEPFCKERGLDKDAVKKALVHGDWMGDDWSGDEDGAKTQEWRDALYATRKITEEERDNPHLNVWERRRPVWMNQKYWETINGLVKDYIRTRPVEMDASGAGKATPREPTRRIDCGHTTNWMPRSESKPYDFMVDPEWAKTEARKWKHWATKEGFPEGLPEAVCLEMIGEDEEGGM